VVEETKYCGVFELKTRRVLESIHAIGNSNVNNAYDLEVNSFLMSLLVLNPQPPSFSFSRLGDLLFFYILLTSRGFVAKAMVDKCGSGICAGMYLQNACVKHDQRIRSDPEARE
jgi:hypothetical protein